MKIFKENNFNQEALIQIYNEFLPQALLETRGRKNFNVINAAAFYGLDELFKKLIKKTNGEGLQSQDKLGRTPIHHLASNGRLDTLSFIFERYSHQVDLSQTNLKGRTALHSAAKHLQMEIIEFLIENGANPNALDVHGNSPLSLAHSYHFLGQDIAFTDRTSQVINFLLPLTTYWQEKSYLRNLQTLNHECDFDILSAWTLGMKHANDSHWIEGISIMLSNTAGNVEYTIKMVYQTELTTFVVLGNAENNVLLCLDKIPSLKQSYYLNKHVSSNYLDILDNIFIRLQQLGPVQQIWGSELAGIDAQLLAKKLNIQKLILINSPGLPEELLSTTSTEIEKHYFFSTNDQLHLSGSYLWSTGANFYTNKIEQQQVEKAQMHSNYLKWSLKGLKRQVSLTKFPFIKRTSYSPGINYAIENSGEIQETTEQKINALFNETNLALSKITDSELIDFARYEYCAHGLAYLHLTPTQENIKWWDIQDSLNFQRIVHHMGLYCYLLQNNNEWILMFQGTNPQDFSTIMRDLDRGSAGIKRIRRQYIDIIEFLSDKLQNQQEKIKLVICGHSLGGADAQNFFSAFLAYLSSSLSERTSVHQHLIKFISRHLNSQNLLEKIHEVSLYAYNAAGIRNSTAFMAKVAASNLKNLLTISVNHQRVNQDIVNLVGETILHDFDTEIVEATNTQVRVRSLFFDGEENMIDRVKHAHTDRQFKQELGSYDLYHENSDGMNDLKKQLNYTNPKIESKSLFYNNAKKLLQKGNVSESVAYESDNQEYKP